MKLASRINANISIDSEPEKGSTFTVVIPNLAANPGPTQAAPTANTAEAPQEANQVPQATAAPSEEAAKPEVPA